MKLKHEVERNNIVQMFNTELILLQLKLIKLLLKEVKMCIREKL